MAAHKHAAVIKAWADGEPIQYCTVMGEWVNCPEPAWADDYEYRVKPAEPEKVYPQTTLNGNELERIYQQKNMGRSGGFMAIANAAIRRACDSGQVVLREEFDRAVGDRAARDMAVAIAVRNTCREIAAKHQMRTGVIEDIKRIDLFAIIDEVKP
jgi:hypothetical protein